MVTVHHFWSPVALTRGRKSANLTRRNLNKSLKRHLTSLWTFLLESRQIYFHRQCGEFIKENNNPHEPCDPRNGLKKKPKCQLHTILFIFPKFSFFPLAKHQSHRLPKNPFSETNRRNCVYLRFFSSPIYLFIWQSQCREAERMRP